MGARMGTRARAGADAGAGQELHALIDAIEKRDAQAVLSHVTRDKPTFQAWEVNRALALWRPDRTRTRPLSGRRYLGQKNVIGLSDTRGRSRQPLHDR